MPDLKSQLKSILGDKYEVLGCVHSGGMGDIYLGTHRFLKKQVAIKLIKYGQSDDLEAKERFYREARLCASIDHSGIIDIYDFGTDQGIDYIIMPFINGVSLSEKIKLETRMDIKHRFSQSA